MEDVKSWLLRILQDNGYSEIIRDQPLFEQIDSFMVVEIILVCEEKYCFSGGINNDGFSKYTFDEIVELILKSN
ncbi:hypothetical protein [Deefgea piscis]|uniref:hypothetical protein n=1 Tax=Deefgea piscis TaxID=2739061 RepID=UPI001C7ED80F|nr:hypothetical protein [Deefgea piscis]QZA80034.1 hypothetical protein K4H25_10815 [Deefgea piscis]